MTAVRESDWEELMNAVYEMSGILNTGLDRQSLRILVNLCEAGVNPEALALAVNEMRKDAARLREGKAQQQPRSHPAN